MLNKDGTPSGKYDPITGEKIDPNAVVDPLFEPVQVERRASPRKKYDRPGVTICCGRCKQELAISRGDTLDCFTFTVDHRVKLKCEACGHETRWGPDKANKSSGKTRDESIDGDSETE